MTILFDLDGTLADCSHRRHLLKPQDYPDLCEYSNYRIKEGEPFIDMDGKATWRYKATGEPFKHGWKEFFEACDKDTPIMNTIGLFHCLSSPVRTPIEIWSGRCESVRLKTEIWLRRYVHYFSLGFVKLKMRPIGDYTPDDQLKERWLLDMLNLTDDKIEMVFDDRPKVLRMWQRRGIYTFDVGQGRGEF